MPSMTNPFDDPALIGHYEQWYRSRGRRADRLEKQLLGRLLADFPGASTALEIGCGTGHFTRWLSQRGLRVVGLDLSGAMLAEARTWDGVRYVRGNAEALPFGDGAFDVVALVTTLEFVSDPRRALSEAIRVAARGVILGVLNRNSLLAVRRRKSGREPWNTARFFATGELARLVRDTTGDRLRSLRWRTTLWPPPIGGNLPLPWGGFIGLAARLD